MLGQEESIQLPAKDVQLDQGRGPEDGDVSRDGSHESSIKRKYVDREPESPGIAVDAETHSPPARKKERAFFGDMDTDSPASYPKHVIVHTSDRNLEDKYLPHSSQMPQGPVQGMPQPTYHPHEKGIQVLTPDSVSRGARAGYDPHQQYHPYHPQQDVYRAPSYTAEMDYGRPYGGQHPQQHQPAPHHQPPYGSSGSLAGTGSMGGENYSRPRRWACDYCNVATFLSYEEACAHEESCARRHQSHHDSPYAHDPRHGAPPRHPPTNYGGHSRGAAPPQGSGLGALYHASQEVVTPPTPHRQHQTNRWGSHGPPLPVLPHEQGYYRQGYYDMREDAVPVPYNPDPHQHALPPPPPQPAYHHPHHPPQEYYQRRMLLALASDRDSLSDRQCYVRAEMVEIFAATTKDVSARHSKGAQKLVVGQVGIRCVFCSHLRPRDRAERAVCYPSSISRIYQTVADMQRFHFEQCREIPDHVRQLYKKLKTTRPRGVGSPQTYWVSSAKTLGLADTEDGIRFDNDMAKEMQQQVQGQSSEMSTN